MYGIIEFGVNNTGKFSINLRLITENLSVLLTPNLTLPKKGFTLAFENKPSVVSTVEPQYNESPPYNERFSLPRPRSSKESEKEPRYIKKPRYSEQN